MMTGSTSPAHSCAGCSASGATAVGRDTNDVAEVESVSFVAFGDWGWDCYSSLQDLASRIDAASSCGGQPCRFLQCAIALGDNFYPDGISSTRDQRVACWRALFSQGPASVPWLVVPGNHDYYSANGIQSQLDLTTDKKRNPDGKWCMGSVVAVSDSAFCTCATSSSESPLSTTSTGVPPAPPPPSRGCRRPPPLLLHTATPTKCPAHCPERVPWAVHSFPIGGTNSSSVDLFLIDTCGAQYSVRNRHPSVLATWPRQKEWLRRALARSTAQWKIVAGHHPLFTHGVGHQNEARCLRGNEYTTMTEPTAVHLGMGLLDVLHEGRADLYLSGHEHAFQVATDVCPTTGHTLQSVGAGNAMETFYWRGKHVSPNTKEGDDFGDDEQCRELLAKRLSSGSAAPPLPENGVTTEAVVTLDQLRGGDAPSVDPHRSLFSRRSHVSTEGPDGGIGVLRLDVTAHRCVVRHIHSKDHPFNEVVLQKE